MELNEKRNLVASLAKSPHGKLTEYVGVASRALLEDADFYAHLVAYNHRRGQVRDAKVALPVLSLGHADPIIVENGLAHMADLRPREFCKAVAFAREQRIVSGHVIERLVTRYLRDLEADPPDWQRTALQHRPSLRTLYARYHVTPGLEAAGVHDAVVFGPSKQHGIKAAIPEGPFTALKQLGSMTPEEAAGAILRWKIPFLMARGAVGEKAKDPSVAMALIKVATPTELVTNIKAFDRLGLKTVPALRAAFDEALGKAGKSRKQVATLKTSRAAEALGDDVKLTAKLHVLQEQQLDQLRGVEGTWLVLGDKSGSMELSIEATRQIAATLTRLVKGKVHLVFFDELPRYYEATGKTLEDLQKLSRTMAAGGGTSIGCGLHAILDRKIDVDGIAIVSDGGENRSPLFADTYTKYVKAMDHEPTVYFYRTEGGVPSGAAPRDVQRYKDAVDHEAQAFVRACQAAKIDVQTFDLRGGTIDYHSLPNLVQTMRVGRYGLIDDVMHAPLLTLDDVLPRTTQLRVLSPRQAVTV